MQLSVWEKESFYAPKDVIIIGSGLTGLWSAYYLKKKYPRMSVAILERGMIPTGASTRNAGFACFGSLTELVQDVELMGENKMQELVSMRWNGLQKLQKLLPAKRIDLNICGGYELITEDKNGSEEKWLVQAAWINRLLYPVTKNKITFRLADKKIGRFGFNNVCHLLENKYEGYLHSGKLCQELLRIVQGMGVTILTSYEVEKFEKNGTGFTVWAVNAPQLTASKILVCTNAFARQLLPALDIVPARGQVLLTSAIEGLSLKGTFHFDGGYYYFRNLGNRILLGGARNKAFDAERTHEMGTTPAIQQELEHFLAHYILPGRQYEITDRWSGIMGMGSDKLPVIKQLSEGVFCAVRMNGMGVALAPLAGEKVAAMMGR